MLFNLLPVAKSPDVESIELNLLCPRYNLDVVTVSFRYPAGVKVLKVHEMAGIARALFCCVGEGALVASGTELIVRRLNLVSFLQSRQPFWSSWLPPQFRFDYSLIMLVSGRDYLKDHDFAYAFSRSRIDRLRIGVKA